MKTRTLSLVCLFATLLAAPVAAPAFAAPSHPTFGTFVNSSGVPSGSKLVINVNWLVTNDEDSGFCGYWALDNYNHQVQIWQAPDGTFYVVARYQGTFTTFAGAVSPASSPPSCTTESTMATGTFEGGYTAVIAGTLNPTPIYSKHGNIGTFDYGGTPADVQKGAYTNGQTGPTSVFSYLAVYFTSVTSFSQPAWGWTYHYQSQTWNNFYYCVQSGGSTPCPGDIVV
jgi:hypothetical protein